MQIRYGSNAVHIDPESGSVDLPLPVLGSIDQETLIVGEATHSKIGDFDLWIQDDLMCGVAVVPVEGENDVIESIAQRIYRMLFRAAEGRYLYRIWNYVPHINEGEGDEERYKKFCEGRSVAFKEEFHNEDEAYLSAGTCVGIEGDHVIVYFLAGNGRPEHHENPNQVPAYRYPRQYGPKSPSFARATSARVADRRYRFISGTAAVLGHESQGIESLEEQVRVTCENLKIIAVQASGGESVLSESASPVKGKVYLRRSEDFDKARALIEFYIPHWSDSLVYVKSDICRKELLIEVELVFEDA